MGRSGTSGRRTVLVVAMAALALAACGPRRTDLSDAATGVALAVAAAPEQDVVIWTVAADGRLESCWIRGSSLDNRIVDVADGAVLPVAGRVWVWRTEKVPVALCDCAAWEAAGTEGACPPAAEMAHGTVARLEDLVTGASMDVLPAPVTETEDGPAFADFAFGMEPVGAVGPYLFVRGHERSLGCGAARHSWASTFAVLDLASGGTVEILSAEERAAVDRDEREAAFAAMKDDRLVRVERASDLELTAIEPGWITGAGLALRYQFTAGASFADSDDSWGAYSRSISVPARNIPEALLPFALLPQVLEHTILPGGEPRVAGVTLADGAPEQLAALARLFGRVE